MKNRDRIHLYHSEDDMDKSSLGAYEQKLKMLLYEWEKVYTYGDAESMCTDGIILNRYRKEILQLKSKLNLLGSKLVCEIPEIMPEEYMAQADTIRTQACPCEQALTNTAILIPPLTRICVAVWKQS